MLKAFRVLSIIEGLSLIVLLFIAMPAKYSFGVDLVKYAGPTHGYLSLIYLLLMEMTCRQQNWTRSFWNLAFFTSSIPFGFFYLETKLRNNALTVN